MKNLLRKFVEKILVKLKNSKNTLNEEKINSPIVYVNKPINDFEHDILGVKTYVDRIDKAIENGANVIGIIGNYGTGKSSLIELLKNKYTNAININMWDGLQENQTEKETPNLTKNQPQKDITNLTKNFLFQMAIGEDTKFAQYISKRLSKNYGVLSIIKSGKRFWLNFIFAIIFFGGYKIAEQLPINIYDTAIYKELNYCFGNNFFPDGCIQNAIFIIYGIIVNFKLIFVLIALFFAIMAILKTTIVFSLWDSQGKREPDTNDIYDTYLEIAKRITSVKSKRVIIIEDLDRTNKIKEIKEFIKEIYRFNNVLPPKIGDKLIYIIEVKSEQAMKEIKEIKEIKETLDDDNNGLYKKVFYFKVTLNPIHNNDCQEILLELLRENENELKEKLGITLQETLPQEFAYIVKGSNLTIRDLKERLNRSFEIYENLINKGGNSGALIDYKKTTIVAYLESTYPKEVEKFTEKEKNFSKILDKSYIIKQKKNISMTEKIQQIQDIIDNSNNDNNNNFTNEVATLIANDLIDDDFRMYFYNYPKGQRIKSAEEIYVENLILYPGQSKSVQEEFFRLFHFFLNLFNKKATIMTTLRFFN